MADTNNSASQAAALPPTVMAQARIYQVRDEATADEIGDHIDLQLSRLRSMLLAVTGSTDTLEELAEDVRMEYLYACAALVEEVINLRYLVEHGARIERKAPIGSN